MKNKTEIIKVELSNLDNQDLTGNRYYTVIYKKDGKKYKFDMSTNEITPPFISTPSKHLDFFEFLEYFNDYLNQETPSN